MSILSKISKLRTAVGGISINRLEKEAGLTRGSMAKWDDHAPAHDKLKKIADYFGVTVDYLLSSDEQEEQTHINENEELTEFLQMLKTRPECRMLFQLSKTATKEDVEAAVRIIEALRNK